VRPSRGGRGCGSAFNAAAHSLLGALLADLFLLADSSVVERCQVFVRASLVVTAVAQRRPTHSGPAQRSGGPGGAGPVSVVGSFVQPKRCCAAWREMPSVPPMASQVAPASFARSTAISRSPCADTWRMSALSISSNQPAMSVFMCQVYLDTVRLSRAG